MAGEAPQAAARPDCPSPQKWSLRSTAFKRRHAPTRPTRPAPPAPTASRPLLPDRRLPPAASRPLPPARRVPQKGGGLASRGAPGADAAAFSGNLGWAAGAPYSITLWLMQLWKQ